jgi:general secretion pathway protein F
VKSFRYTALDPSGQLISGEMDAPNEDAVIRSLQEQGSIPVRAELNAGAGKGGFSLFGGSGGKGLSKQELADITQKLGTMVGAGQDLDRSMRFLVETARNKRVRDILEQIRAILRDGGSLAAALDKHPASFPRIYVGLIRAGEAGGTLAPTLERLALLLQRQRALNSTVVSAMIYPSLLVVAATGAIVLLLTQVLPQFVPLFEQNGAPLPRSTQILIDTGAFVGHYGLAGLLLGIVGTIAFTRLLQQPAFRLRWDQALLRIPVIGGLIREIVAARFSRTLGTLLINDVPLIAALEIVRDAVGNLAGVEALDHAIVRAKGGGGLSRPLEESKLFPMQTIYLLRLGEETAQLGDMALKAAEIHEENTRTGIQRVVSLLVPVITIVMGAAVAGIVSSLLMAMLGLNDLAH